MDFGILWPTDVTIRLVDITTNSTMVTVFFATSPKLCNVHRKTSFAGGKFGNFFLLFCPHVSNKETRPYFSFQRELSNGSIFHKRHKTLFNREDYEIYHFQVGELQEEGFDRVYKVCSTESLINVSIIQGAKKPYLFLGRKHLLAVFLIPAARPLVDFLKIKVATEVTTPTI